MMRLSPVLVRFKACQRCGAGDMCLGCPEEHCIQCGWQGYFPRVAKVNELIDKNTGKRHYNRADNHNAKRIKTG